MVQIWPLSQTGTISFTYATISLSCTFISICLIHHSMMCLSGNLQYLSTYCIYIYLLANTLLTEFWQSPHTLVYDDKWCNDSLNITWFQSTSHCHCWAHDSSCKQSTSTRINNGKTNILSSLSHKYTFPLPSVSQSLQIKRSPPILLKQTRPKEENVLLVPTHLKVQDKNMADRHLKI